MKRLALHVIRTSGFAAMSLLGIAGCGSAATVHRGPRNDRSFDIAITVDDLPAHGLLPGGMTRLGIAKLYLSTLRAHGVPEAFGFVNAAKIAADPQSEQVLRAWRQAGYPLGNHGYAHQNLDGAKTFEIWMNDVRTGEPMVAKHMYARNWHWYRFPNLSTGADLQRHDAAAAYLESHGYRVASVSTFYRDWSYTDAYARCVAKGDQQAIADLKAAYLKGVDAGIARMKAASLRVYDRMIPQVLLTHLGSWSAITLSDVLKRIEAAGGHYVTLEHAQADPAYAAAERIPGGGDIVDRTAKERKVDLSDLPDPQVPLHIDDLCK